MDTYACATREGEKLLNKYGVQRLQEFLSNMNFMLLTGKYNVRTITTDNVLWKSNCYLPTTPVTLCKFYPTFFQSFQVSIQTSEINPVMDKLFPPVLQTCVDLLQVWISLRYAVLKHCLCIHCFNMFISDFFFKQKFLSVQWLFSFSLLFSILRNNRNGQFVMTMKKAQLLMFSSRTTLTGI